MLPPKECPANGPSEKLGNAMGSYQPNQKTDSFSDNRTENFRSYLILYNISKPNNLGMLLRTASALGVYEILIVGRRNYGLLGVPPKTSLRRRRHFHHLNEALEYLRSQNVAICGVEILPCAIPVEQQPFHQSTAFMIGNEQAGLTQSQIDCCDFFVYVPQFGSVACLNVNVATGIVLHHFASWANYEEGNRSGGKFVPKNNSTSELHFDVPR